jgi:hypothetical protein
MFSDTGTDGRISSAALRVSPFSSALSGTEGRQFGGRQESGACAELSPAMPEPAGLKIGVAHAAPEKNRDEACRT